VNKAIKMGKASATGSFHLFIGQIFSTIMLAISSIIVGLYISQGDYGLFTIALVPIATFILFQDWGVEPALTKYCATFRAEKKEAELKKIIISGLTFKTITGLLLTLISFLTAGFFASSIYNNPESAFLITLASITIFFGSIHGSSLSIFVGFERMELNTVTMIVAAIVHGFLSPLLVYLGYGALGVMIGYTFSSIAAGVTAVLLLYFKIFRKLSKEPIKKKKIFQTLKTLLKYGIPLSISAIIGGVLPQVNQFLMASSTDLAMIGNYKISLNFATFLAFFSIPISTVLFPAFSKLDPKKDRKLLKTVFTSSVKYSSLFLVPATMGIVILSNPLISTLFSDKWPSAPIFLSLGVISSFFVLLGNLSFGRLLVGTGETSVLLKLNLLNLCIGVPLAFLLIPPFGILGLLLVSSVVGVPSLIVGLYWIWKRYGTKADYSNSARIFIASMIAGLVTYIFLNMVVAAAWILLIVGALIYLVLYIFCISFVGAINQMDIVNLRVMFSELGPISKLLQILLALIEKPLKIKEKYSKASNQK